MTHTSSTKDYPETQEISLRLVGGYEDIFSDFDVRPYSRRSLSVDFIDEICRASGDKHHEGIDLVMHVPLAQRNESHEATIRERLTGHFKKHYALTLADRRRVLKKGFFMIGIGALCMIAATLVEHYELARSIVNSFFLVFLEPAAWFLLWEGMDQVIFESKSKDTELNFYRKMADSRGHIHFKHEGPQA
ncbi:MAG: hypothetical protein Q8L64_03435 [bacterium]|nr:hypothetical protein [bacterium]